MQNVLWPECEWKAVTIGDVLTADGVKKYYKKAIVMFHPDKLEGLDDQHKRYIADRVFNGLNDAFKDFKVLLSL